MCSEYYMENNIFDYVVIEALKESLLQLDAYFEKYELTTVRTGWWSELYAEKWNIDKKANREYSVNRFSSYNEVSLN